MSESYWSLFSHQGDVELFTVYNDALGRAYSYDSHVVNSSRISEGDIVIVRDEVLVFGYGVVQSIERRPGVKQMRRCPHCGSSGIAERKVARPALRCTDCKREFDAPVLEPKGIVEFIASYEDTWLELADPVPVEALRPIFAGRDQQNAIRRLDPDRAANFLRRHLGIDAEIDATRPPRALDFAHGHADVRARARRGQAAFRQRLLQMQGGRCAVTGRQPPEILDAAHLYAYAREGEHRRGGGLLLRTDVHRLFDKLLLTIDPGSMSTRVAPQLVDAYASMRDLDGIRLRVTGEQPDLGYLETHMAAALRTWKQSRNFASVEHERASG